MSIPEDAPKPRLCHIRKLPNFAGFGFNLHAEKGKTGQYIGKVDEGSPADLAGLKEGDRIVEVNGTNIGNENHQQVVQRIKAVDGETKFLVVDAEADAYYKERKIVIRGDLDSVEMLQTPLPDDTPKQNGESTKHRARLCLMKIWSDFPGYGFNLHAEKGKSAQFIGKVDEKSPAEAAGLREGDRIYEVNGASVLSETHGDVVRRIKADPQQVTMLLVDPEAEEYFKEKNITVFSTHSSVQHITCPDTNPHAAGVKAEPKMFSDEESNVHKLRRCHIIANANGFGFNMQAEKGRTGQFIGAVDADSPAERAGLKSRDRIVEVNDVNIEKDTHKQVVEKIKAVPNETTLLVVDPEADKYFTEKGIALSSSLACVVICDSKLENGNSDHADNDSNGDNYEKITDEIVEVAKKAEKEDEKKKTEESKPSLALKIEATSTAETKKTTEAPKVVESPKSPVVISGIEFAASAEEARRKMSKKKSVKDTSMRDRKSVV